MLTGGRARARCGPQRLAAVRACCPPPLGALLLGTTAARVCVCGFKNCHCLLAAAIHSKESASEVAVFVRNDDDEQMVFLLARRATLRKNLTLTYYYYYYNNYCFMF